MAMTLAAMLVTAALFLGMLLLHALGQRLGARALLRNPDALKGSRATEGAVFALLGLVVAFNFSGAGGRFEARRALITEEANDIGTAYLRVDLLAPAVQPVMRNHFRRYAELRAAPLDLSTRSPRPCGTPALQPSSDAQPPAVRHLRPARSVEPDRIAAGRIWISGQGACGIACCRFRRGHFALDLPDHRPGVPPRGTHPGQRFGPRTG